MMKRIVIALTVLVMATLIGLAIKYDPGYLLLYFRHWTVEMPLWLGLLLLVVIVWLIQFIWRCGYLLFNRHGRLRRWYHDRDLHRGQQRLRDARWALLHGRWQRAEKLFIADEGVDKYQLTNLLAAAKAAHEQGAFLRRDHYFSTAYKKQPDQQVIIAIAEATLAVAQQQQQRALMILQPLADQAAQCPPLVKQLYPLYLHDHNWAGLLDLLPFIKKYKLLSVSAMETIALRCYGGKLAVAEGDVSQLRRLWQRIPPALRQKSLLLDHYVAALLKVKGDDEALAVVVAALRKGWHDVLAERLGIIRATDTNKQLTQAQGLLKLHGQHQRMVLVVATLAIRCQQWSQAKTLLHRIIDRGASKEAYTQLGFVYQKLGDAARACQFYQQGAGLP